jgi:hypothetical protein
MFFDLMSSPNYNQRATPTTKGTWCKKCQGFMTIEEGQKHYMNNFEHTVNFFDTTYPPGVEMARMENVPLDKFPAWVAEQNKKNI